MSEDLSNHRRLLDEGGCFFREVLLRMEQFPLRLLEEAPCFELARLKDGAGSVVRFKVPTPSIQPIGS